MAKEVLVNHSVFGLDVENNKVTSYDGFVCLVQMSAYDENGVPITYIFDTLKSAIRSNFKELIGLPILQDPSKIKVMHGCL